MSINIFKDAFKILNKCDVIEICKKMIAAKTNFCINRKFEWKRVNGF